MKKWKRVLRWVLFALLMLAIALTFAVLVGGILEIRESEKQAQSGMELLGAAVVAGWLSIWIPMALIMEISVYRNCRYFLSENRKTALTVLNAVMLTVSVSWGIGILLEFSRGVMSTAGDIVTLGSFAVLLVLRFVYLLVRCGYWEEQEQKKESV